VTQSIVILTTHLTNTVTEFSPVAIYGVQGNTSMCLLSLYVLAVLSHSIATLNTFSQVAPMPIAIVQKLHLFVYVQGLKSQPAHSSKYPTGILGS
jgi:hypothetical protein